MMMRARSRAARRAHVALLVDSSRAVPARTPRRAVEEGGRRPHAARSFAGHPERARRDASRRFTLGGSTSRWSRGARGSSRVERRKRPREPRHRSRAASSARASLAGLPRDASPTKAAVALASSPTLTIGRRPAPKPPKRRNDDRKHSPRRAPRRLRRQLRSGHARPPRSDRARVGALLATSSSPSACTRRASPLFSADERIALVESVAKHFPNVAVDSFDGLLIDFCREDQRARHRPRPARGDRLRVRAADRARQRRSAPRGRHDLPADAHEARLRQRVARPRDREPRRRREPLRAEGRLRRARAEVRKAQAGSVR